MRLKGGNKGLLQNSRNICKQAFRATVKMDAHNGKISDTKPMLKASCGKKAKKGKRQRRADPVYSSQYRVKAKGRRQSRGWSNGPQADERNRNRI
jgi:hypothetical protein